MIPQKVLTNLRFRVNIQERSSPEMKNIVFRNCDLIHNTTAVIDVGNCDRADIHDVLFEDLRIEFSKHDVKPIFQSADDVKFIPQKQSATLIDMFLGCGMWSVDNLYGKISDVVFRNISIFSDCDFKPVLRIKGNDGEHDVKNVSIANVTFNGKHLKTLDAFDIKTNEFASFEIL